MKITPNLGNRKSALVLRVIAGILSIISFQNFSSADAGPYIQSFSPTSGPVGTVITVLGSGFTGTTSAGLAPHLKGLTFQVITDSEIKLTITEGEESGQIDITNPFGTSFSPVEFAITCNPSIYVGSDASGVKRFYLDGTAFVPIGVNYLIEGQGTLNGVTYNTFDMFDTQKFSLSTIDQNMQLIAGKGFNYVRLFLKGVDTDNGFSAGSSNGSFNPVTWDKYVSNIATTIQVAEKYGLHVVLTGVFNTDDMWVPASYLPPASTLPPVTAISGWNRLMLIPQIGQALGQFYHDLLTGLVAKDPNIGKGIFYFDIYTEVRYDLNKVPLSQNTGTFTYNSTTYDLSDFNSNDAADSTSRQALMDRATQDFTQMVTDKVKGVLPQVLVASSSFYNAGFGHLGFDGGILSSHTPNYIAMRPYYVLKGGADLIDIHTYPSPGFDLRAVTDLDANELIPVNSSAKTATTIDATLTPLIAGEFGAYPVLYGVTKNSTQAEYTDALETALAEMQATEKSAFCNFDFSGYGVWSWNGVSDTFTLDAPTTDPGYLYMKLLAPKYTPTFCGEKISQ